MAPVALDALIDRARVARDEVRWLAAAQRADFWNAHRGENDEPVTPAYFMPGAAGVKSEQDELREFIDKIQRGEKIDPPPPAQVAAFRAAMQNNFRNVKPLESCST
jgi:hypothetical protein